MTDARFHEIVTVIPRVITSLGVPLGVWFSYRAQRLGLVNKGKLEEVRSNIDGHMTAMTELVSTAITGLRKPKAVRPKIKK